MLISESLSCVVDVWVLISIHELNIVSNVTLDYYFKLKIFDSNCFRIIYMNFDSIANLIFVGSVCIDV